MKKLLSVLLSIVLIISVAPLGLFSITASAETSGIYTYTVSGGKAEIIKCDSSVSGSITIPSTLGGYPVTTIGRWAFENCTRLTSIAIPNSVIGISSDAFANCAGIESITVADGNTAYYSEGNCIISKSTNALVTGCKNSIIPNYRNVKCICQYAFCGCTGLTSIKIPYSVTYIEDYAFKNCKGLTRVKISDSVRSIENFAFYGCSALTSINIPYGVESIKKSTFEGCRRLASITIPESVESIENYAFYGCGDLAHVYYSGTKEASAKISIGSYNTWLTNATWHYNTTTSIGDCGSNLTWEYDPFTLTLTIFGTGEMAVFRADGLVTKAPWGAYYNEMKTVLIDSGATSISDYAFYGCTGLTSITIPDSVTSIGSYAFEGCTSLTRITIPDGVTSIGSYAFKYCRSLTSITIPDSVTEIGVEAFLYCSELRNAIIGNGVTSIACQTFAGCGRLRSITIPDSVTSIGMHAFSENSELINVYYFGTETQYLNISIDEGNMKLTEATWYYNTPVPANSCGDNVIWEYDISTSTLLISGTGSMRNHAKNVNYHGNSVTTAPWSGYYDIMKTVVIKPGVTSIGNYAFYGCTGLTSITIPDSVTSIGSYAFGDCTRLTSVTIGNSVTSIGESAFEYCKSLTSITIPDSVTSISKYAFYWCTGLTSVTIGDSVTEIGSEAFYGCKGLISVNIFDIGSWCNINFSDSYSNPLLFAKKLYVNGELATSITIPDSVTSIGYAAFRGCTGLMSITIPDSVTSIGSYAFGDCTGLTSVTIGDGVTSIGYYAFSGCTGLVTAGPIGGGYNYEFGWKTKIPSDAFSGCTWLTSITIPDSVTEIGWNAFSGCTGLTDVYYGSTVAKRESIKIGSYNKNLLVATWHYTEPAVCSHTPASAVIENNIPATCVNAGSYDSVVYCADCGEELSRENITVPATGVHNLVNNYDGVLHTATCQHCDYTEVEEFTYSVSDGKATITKCDTSVSGAVTIPSNLGGYPVTVISASSFRDCSGITSVTMPNTVTSIGNYAFRGCTALSSVTISDNATYIGLGAFRDTALTSVTIPDSVVTLDSYAFYNCTSLKTAVIGSAVTSIGAETFRNCTAITTVTLGGAITSVGENAFSGCTALNRVNILGNMANWCKISFNGYNANPVYFAKNLYLNGELVTDVIIPDSVNTIGSYAFWGYKKITSLTIGSRVTSIGDAAFMNCTGITSITVKPGNTAYHSAGNCLIETNSKTLIFGCNSSVIPNNGTVTSIASYAFYYCTGLKSVIIPNSVTTIGRYAFEGCSGIETLTLSNSLTEISCVFRGCSKLTSIEIPDSVTTIGDRAFMTCTSLKSITIPTSVTAIVSNAFSGCSSSCDVYYLGTEAQRSGITIDSGNALNTMEWHCLGIPRDTMRNNTGFIKNKFEFATFNEQNKHEIGFESAKDITDTKMIELDVYVNGAGFDTGIAICDSLGNSALYNFTGLKPGWNHLAVRVSDLVQYGSNTANVNLSDITKCVLSGEEGEEVTVANLYAADYVEGDANRDGVFDIRDVVRAKKMAAGDTAEGNKLAVSGDDYEINAVDLTNLIHSIIDSLFV